MSGDHALTVSRLAGLSPNRTVVRYELPEHELGELCERILAAKNKAGLTTNKFKALNRAALKVFCGRFGFSRAEVRLAQYLVVLARAMRRTNIIAEHVARARMRSGYRGGPTQ